jgi:hypothetical protein
MEKHRKVETVDVSCLFHTQQDTGNPKIASGNID